MVLSAIDTMTPCHRKIKFQVPSTLHLAIKKMGPQFENPWSRCSYTEQIKPKREKKIMQGSTRCIHLYSSAEDLSVTSLAAAGDVWGQQSSVTCSNFVQCDGPGTAAQCLITWPIEHTTY